MAKKAAEPKRCSKSKAAKATAAPVPAVVPGDSEEPTPPVPVPESTAKHMVRMHTSLRTIRDHPLFADIDSLEPLSISAGGYQAPFDSTECRTVLTDTTAQYKCGFNIMRHDILWLAAPRVPISSNKINEYRSFNLDPANPPTQLTQTVLAVDPTVDPISVSGLQRLSPPEPTYAWAYALAEAIDKGFGEGILLRWKKLLLTASVAIESVPPGESRYWRAQNLRQELIEIGDVSKLTVREQILDVAGFKQDKERELGRPLSCPAVAKIWLDNVTFAKSSEAVSTSWIEVAVTVYNRVLAVPSAMQLIEWCDENNWNIISSVHWLHALVKRATDKDHIVWALQGLLDFYRFGHIDQGTLSVRSLLNPRTSYIEILNLKYDVKHHLLHTWLPRSGMHVDHIKLITLKFDTFESVRSFVENYPEFEPADNSWQCQLNQSAMDFCDLLDNLVYNTTYDARYRDALRSHLTIAEFLEYDSIASIIASIEAYVKTEIKPCVIPTPGLGDSPTPPTATTAAPGTIPLIEAQDADGNTVPIVPGWNTLPDDQKTFWERFIMKQISLYIKIIDDKASKDLLAAAIKEVGLNSMIGDMMGMVLYYFDGKNFGESQHRPDLRTPPLRDAPYFRIVRACLEARHTGAATQPASIGVAEAAVLLDGGKKGNAPKLMAPWKEGTKAAKKTTNDDDDEADDDDDDDNNVGDTAPSLVPDILNLVYTEASMSGRKKRVRGGTASVKQIESAHIIASSKIGLPTRPRKNYAGTSAGDTILDIETPNLASEWHITWKEKKNMLGKKHLIPVGGKTAGSADAPGPLEKKTDDTMVPVTWWPMPEKWYDELIHMFFAKLVFDLSPSDGKFAWVALQNHIGYIGIAYTDAHRKLIMDHLIHKMKEALGDPTSKFFNKEFALATGVTAADVVPPNSRNRDSGAGRGRGGRGRGGGRGAKRTIDVDDDDGAGDADKPAKPKPKRPRAGAASSSDAALIDAEGLGDAVGSDGEDVWDPLADDVEDE